jgi:hypothetical protein
MVSRNTRGQCYKTNTAVIYCHFRLNYHRNIYNWNDSKLLQYAVNYCGILTLEIIGFSYCSNFTMRNYCNSFITLAPVVYFIEIIGLQVKMVRCFVNNASGSRSKEYDGA